MPSSPFLSDANPGPEPPREDGEPAAASAPEAERQRLREILERMPDRVILLHRDERIEYVNPAMAGALGIPAETLVGRFPAEIEPAQPELDRLRPEFRRVVDTGAPSSGERTVETPGGRRTSSYTMTPLFDPDGRVASVMLTSRDVTPLVEARAALAESEAKYRNLVELSPDAILIHQDGLIVFANPAAAALLGHDRPGALVGRGVLELVHPGIRGRVASNIGMDLRGEESPLTTVDLVRADGSIVTAQGRGAMIPFGGRPAIQVVLRDVTAEKRAEAAVLESERRHAFLLALGDRLREPGDPGEIMAVASEMVGRHLGANGVVYCEVDPGGECATVRADWNDGTVPSVTGPYRMDDFGIGNLYRRGLVRRTEDVMEEHGKDQAAEHRALRIRASLGAPICRSGTLAAVLAVHSAHPRCWTDAEVELLREAGDRIWGAVERARAEAARRVSEERLRLAQESAAIGIWDRNAVTDRVTISPEFLRRYGLEAGAIACFTDWERLIHPGDRAGVEAGRRAAFAAGGPLELEFRVILPSGEERWIQFKGQGVRNGQGALERVIGVLIDVTTRRRTEEALREREQTLQGIFRAAPVGIGMVSHRVITRVNDQLCRMTGYAPDELIGQDARLFYPDDEAYDLVGREKYAQIAVNGVGAVETRWRTRDGAVLDILLSSSPVDLSRPHENVVFSALDISRLKETERAVARYMDELERSNEELQRFAYVASHDLQEPLRSIISFSQLLERKYRGQLDQDADEYIAFIVEGGNRMQQLILDLLQLSRVETRARPLAPTDTAEVVADALRLMETPIREADATVEVGDLPTVMADAAQLVQVFVNLIGNALKYRRPDVAPIVRISVERSGGFWRFAVQDNGIGIEKEYFDRIFVIFQRLHTRSEYEGTGIGLAVVRKIIDRHGGRVGVESVPGEGSTFFFTLPAA